LIALSLCSKKQDLVVLDFGGGAGIHYDIFKQTNPEVSVTWLIVETSTMKQSAQQRKPEVEYFTNIDDLMSKYQQIDCVFANSSIQYVDDPLTLIDNIVSLSPEIFVMARTAMHENVSFQSIQRSRLEANGPGMKKSSLGNIEISYPISVLCEQEYLEKFNKSELIFRIQEGLLSGIEGDYSTCNLVTLAFRCLRLPK
jgi:putative methyltransferase (TIGR04325 family)